jgi:hypothetical protein
MSQLLPHTDQQVDIVEVPLGLPEPAHNSHRGNEVLKNLSSILNELG